MTCHYRGDHQGAGPGAQIPGSLVHHYDHLLQCLLGFYWIQGK